LFNDEQTQQQTNVLTTSTHELYEWDNW